MHELPKSRLGTGLADKPLSHPLHTPLSLTSPRAQPNLQLAELSFSWTWHRNLASLDLVTASYAFFCKVNEDPPSMMIMEKAKWKLFGLRDSFRGKLS
jgi:hypothetical protein